MADNKKAPEPAPLRDMDFNRSYGICCGHAFAVYQQDGIYFNTFGQEVIEPATLGTLPEVPEKLSEEAWLREILSGGNVLKSNIYKQCQIDNYDWDAIGLMALELSVQFKAIQGEDYWALAAE